LKNENRLLPLQKDKIKTIAVIGPVANAVIPDWYSGKPPYKVTILDGIRNAVGEKANILYAKSNKADSAITLARQADVVVVCIGNHPICNNTGLATSYVPSDGKEAIDRQAYTTEQEDLVKLVKAANPNTVLVLVSSFPFAINWSKEHVPAILHVSQSSQELGNGVADILFGNENPAGRLVQTWPASIDDLPPMLDYDITHGRTYMYSKTKPLFALGMDCRTPPLNIVTLS
jgi:beta-glucosidase